MPFLQRYVALEGGLNLKLKIVLLPLDERPCNAAFASKLFGGPDVTIKTPEFMGWKKEAADPEKMMFPRPPQH